MRNLNIGALAVLGVVFLLALGALPASAREDVTITELADLQTGDYLLLELNADEFVDGLGENVDPGNYTAYKNLAIDVCEYRVTGSEAVTVGDAEYDCDIAVLGWGMSFALEFDEDKGLDGPMAFDMSLEQRVWLSPAHEPVRGEMTSSSEMSFSMNGTEYLFRSESTRKETYTKVGNKMKLPMLVGDTWSDSVSYGVNSTTRTWDRETDTWETEYEDYTVDETTRYEVLESARVTVPAGTFDALKVKEQVMDGDAHEIVYYRTDGIFIKRTVYSDGMPEMAFELSEYSLADDAVGGADGADGADGTDDGDGTGGTDGTDATDGTDGADGADGEDGEDGTDPDTLEGTWTGGQEGEAGGWTFRFTGDGHAYFTGPDASYEGTFTTDDTRTPPTMDVAITSGGYAGKTTQGIYQIEDGELKMALGEPGTGNRPTTYDDPTAVVFTAQKASADSDPTVGDEDDMDDDDGGGGIPGFEAALVLGAMGALAMALIVGRRTR